MDVVHRVVWLSVHFHSLLHCILGGTFRNIINNVHESIPSARHIPFRKGGTESAHQSRKMFNDCIAWNNMCADLAVAEF